MRQVDHPKKQLSQNAGRRDCINAYANALRNLWIKAFGVKYISETKRIGIMLRKFLSSYFNQVTCNRRTTKSKRELIREWRSNTEHNKLFDILKSTVDPESFDDDEKQFYFAQKSNERTGYISDVTDFAYENKRCEEAAKLEHEEQLLENELSFIEGDELPLLQSSFLDSSDSLMLSQSCNRSGTVRVTMCINEKQIQTDDVQPDRPVIRKIKRCTDDIKAACAKVSADCGISVEKSRKAVQTTCKVLYHHDFYLTKEEQVENEPIPTSDETRVHSGEPQCKQPRITDPQSNKTPVSKEDYINYSYVLPSAKTIVEYKHLQATQEERDAAITLFNKPDSVVVTLHFDTTSRNSIDGEWPSLILIFSDGNRFRLRPIFFAYEDRANIARLIVESYTRLALTVSTVINENISAQFLWEKTNNLMTDAVTKNLKIEDLVAESLNSTYKPNHLLCKSHTVEKMDDSNLKVLADLESKIKLKEKLGLINPSLRPFFRGKKAICIAGITALLKLVTHDKSANTTSLAEDFDYIVEREGQTKHMSLYHERRFTKLGYAAASLLHALPLLQMLLAETSKTNLLVEACKLYLECEFFLTELQVLAYFTYKVTLPLLNCVERSDQAGLLKILPKLHEDLKNGSMDTLKDFLVEYRHVPVNEPSSNLEKEILCLMCADAADGIKMQCGREYGFSDEGEKSRATELHKLSSEQLNNLPTNNLDCERDLAKFSHLSGVARFRNKTFQAKGIRTDMTLYQANQTVVESITRKIHNILLHREAEWTCQQKDLQKQRIILKMNKAKKEQDYTKRLLELCKSWGGPCTTPDQLEVLLKANPDSMEKIVKTELSYYRHTHKSDIAASPDLFKLVRISHEELLENLCILLSDDNRVATTSSASAFDLPSNQDVLNVIQTEKGVTTKDTNVHSSALFKVNDLCVTVWDLSGQLTWFIGYIKEEMESGDFMVEHLDRMKSGKDDFWRYPTEDDTQKVSEQQIMPCKVDGDWDTSNVRNTKFILKNSKPINNTFKQFIL